MRNLNVDFSDADKKVKQLDKVNDWAHPVGWWKVTTEGDCEGKSTDQLGTHYGHIAEIAFALAGLCEYSLQFQPVHDREPGVEIQRKANRRKVNISFAGGPLNARDPNTMDVYNWMNIHGVNVRDCNYYGAVTIEAMKG